jgi:hypothetical protein
MPGFYGAESVIASRDKHLNTGDVYAGTLRVRASAGTFTSVAWANYYLDPEVEQSALGGGGIEPLAATLYLWQIGETTAPRPDDCFLDADGETWLLTSVKSRLTADADHGVHDCRATRVV